MSGSNVFSLKKNSDELSNLKRDKNLFLKSTFYRHWRTAHHIFILFKSWRV